MRGESRIGKRYGLWTVLDDHLVGFKCLCKCDCGTIRAVCTGDLEQGKSTNCGCVRRENARRRGLAKRIYSPEEGRIRSLLRKRWEGMHNRCYDPSNPSYQRYGGRGITVCDEWQKDFETFYQWSLQNGYKEGLTIDRIDNDGPYSPNNCHYTTMKTQARNRSSNVLIDGLTVTDWCALHNVPRQRIYRRLYDGWKKEDLEAHLEDQRSNSKQDPLAPRCAHYGFPYADVRRMKIALQCTTDQALEAYTEKYDLEDIYENILANDALANDPDYLASLYQIDDDNEDR